MSSLRCLSGAALLGLFALWSGCGGVADPGPLVGYEDGDGGSSTGDGASGAGTAGGFTAAGGGNASEPSDGGSRNEGMDPELGIDGTGGRNGKGGSSGIGGTASAGAGGAEMGGAGGTGPGAGGTESNIGGTDSGTGGADPGAGGTEGGAGGTETSTGGTESGIGGTASGTGGTETSAGGTDSSAGGTDSSAGGTESGIGGTDPGTGGTESGIGGTGSGSGGDSGSGGAGGDLAQGGSGQGGSAEPPPIVDVEVGSCEPFEACGGNVDGVWTYTAACVDLDDLGASQETIDDMCPGAQITLSGQVSGTLTFANGAVTRRGQSSAQGAVFVPALCALGLGGCDGVEAELADGGLVGTVCVAQGNPFFPSCNCRFELTAPDIDEVPFVTDGDVIHLEDGRDFAYCAAGDDLTYVEIGTATEPGVRELSRR